MPDWLLHMPPRTQIILAIIALFPFLVMVGFIFRILSGVHRLIVAPWVYLSRLAAAKKAVDRSEYPKAEELLRAAIDAASKFAERDQVLALPLAKLASAYRDQGKYNEAEWPQTWAVTILENAGGVEVVELGSALASLADLYRLQVRHEAADPVYARAIAMLDAKSYGAGPELALFQENHASLLRELGRETEAIELEARAAAIRAGAAE